MNLRNTKYKKRKIPGALCKKEHIAKIKNLISIKIIHVIERHKYSIQKYEKYFTMNQ